MAAAAGAWVWSGPLPVLVAGPRPCFLAGRNRRFKCLQARQRSIRTSTTQWEFLALCSASESSNAANEDLNKPRNTAASAADSDSASSCDAAALPSRPSWWLRLRKLDLRELILKLPHDEKAWTVPWTGQTIFQVMFLWFGAFWFVGSWIIPISTYCLGINKDTLSYRGQALLSLITDVSEGIVGIAILQRCLAQFQPLSADWFPIRWRGLWFVEALLGCLIFPLVNRLSQINLDLLPMPAPFDTSNLEQCLSTNDPVATICYVLVVSVCAPVWEEVIFRGFLLPSLTRYLPLWAAISVSAMAFALAHFSVQRLLPLTFLGLVMGIVFVRNRNLLPSILLHSLWNGFVFVGLMGWGQWGTLRF